MGSLTAVSEQSNYNRPRRRHCDHPARRGRVAKSNRDLPELPLNTEDGINHFGPNPFFGRVLYTYGLTLDQPLSIIRMDYGDRLTVNNVEAGYRKLDPFSIIPLWDERGQPHAGVSEDGVESHRPLTTSPEANR